MLMVSDEEANASKNDRINKVCNPIRNRKDCDSNENCWWNAEKNFCTRDSRTMESAELEGIVRDELSQAPSTPTPPTVQIPKPSSNSLFIVKHILPTDQAIVNLPQTHFLKTRREEPYTEFRRFRDTPGLEIKGNSPALNKQLIAESRVAEQKHYSMMKANPIFLYAHEQPVQILSPDEHKDKIGTLTIVPGSENRIRTLILPGTNSGSEVVLPSSNTTVLFDDEHLMATQMQEISDVNSKNTKYTQFDETDDDFVYYTDDEKRDHPTLRLDQRWIIRNGQWTIVGDAGGGRRTRRTGRSRRSRKTRTLRKRNGCKLRKRRNTRHTRHTRPRK